MLYETIKSPHNPGNGALSVVNSPVSQMNYAECESTRVSLPPKAELISIESDNTPINPIFVPNSAKRSISGILKYMFFQWVEHIKL